MPKWATKMLKLATCCSNIKIFYFSICSVRKVRHCQIFGNVQLLLFVIVVFIYLFIYWARIKKNIDLTDVVKGDGDQGNE